MPSWELADLDSSELDRSLPTVSVEAGVTLGWSQFADKHVGIDRFGSSAPGNVVMDELGINYNSIEDALS